jgi:hypothetical protein
MTEENNYIIISINGGHGKVILATAFIEAVKKQYPDYKIIVVTAWEAPLINNPNIYRVYTFGQTPYFFNDFIEGNEDNCIIMALDPYLSENHILGKSHLIKTWCSLYNIPYNGEQPKLYLNPREIEVARERIGNDQRPIMMIQSNGGVENGQSPRSWARDLPTEIAQGIVNHYSKEYRILQIRTEKQILLQGVESVILPHRELYGIMMFSKKRLFIDSFAQHAAAALGLPSTVCWIANKPEIFGYSIHDNILPNIKEITEFNKYSFLERFDITGNAQQFPYGNVNLFDINQIAESINKQ